MQAIKPRVRKVKLPNVHRGKSKTHKPSHITITVSGDCYTLVPETHSSNWYYVPINRNLYIWKGHNHL